MKKTNMEIYLKQRYQNKALVMEHFKLLIADVTMYINNQVLIYTLALQRVCNEGNANMFAGPQRCIAMHFGRIHSV